MNNKFRKVTEVFLTLILIFSIFSFSSCEQVEEVSLDSAGIQSIAVTKLPDKIKYLKSDSILDTSGLVVTASYRSGTTKVIPLSELKFSGFKESSGQSVNSEQIIITYKAGSDQARYCTYTIYYEDLNTISIITNPSAVSYVMNADSSTGINGGIGISGVKRTDASNALTDISDWHFNVDGLKLSVNYLNGVKTLTFVNRNDESCYGTGTGTDAAYVYDRNGKFEYMQRWSEETDSNGQRFKIKIEGFDPVAVFTTVKDSLTGLPQYLTVSFTDNGVTSKTSLQISYTFGATYKKTESINYIDGSYNEVLFGDYPQSEKSETVKINKTKIENGLYNYQLGSDGNYYCRKTDSDTAAYYKVEPITWVRMNKNSSEYYYRANKILDTGIPYYQGKSERTSQKTKNYKWKYSGIESPATVNFTYNLDKYSFIYSTIRNWLNGDNQNGDSTYNGKGFLQTAFTTAAQKKLVKIPVREYCRTVITATGTCVDSNGNTVGSHEGTAVLDDGFVYKEESSVPVVIPGYKNSTPLYTVMKEYDYTTDNEHGPATRIQNAQAEESPVYFNESREYSIYPSLNDRLEYTPPSYSDFCGDRATYWLATDAMCDVSGSAWMESDKADVMNRETLSQSAVTTESINVGILPVIRFEL